MNFHYISLLTLCYIFLSFLSTAQSVYTLSGYIKDESSGETLIGANVFLQENQAKGTSSNNYGFYSIQLPTGEHNIIFSFIGYKNQILKIDLTENKKADIKLTPEGASLSTSITVTAENDNANIENTEMGVIQLPTKEVKQMPALLGEVDLLKIVQLLPGITSAAEGNTGFFVRGGGQDQNLILLDEAVVYNAGHVLGFFSVFNADAIKNTTIVKGGMPANYGGRLSSVLDIRMKEGNNQNTSIEGGIGVIASRFTIQGPIQKEKSSFIISGRRTYAYDLARPFLKSSDFEGTNYYFYDLNTKINYTLSPKDKIYFSSYFGKDVLGFTSRFRDANFGVDYGNLTSTFRWNHLFSSRLFMNTSIIYNNYDYAFRALEFGIDANIKSGIEDWNLKIDFDYLSTPHDLKFGLNIIKHKLTPNFSNVTSTASGMTLFDRGEPRFSTDYALYLLDNIKVNPVLSLNIGTRLSAYTFLGPYQSQQSEKIYNAGESVINYFRVEPRIVTRWQLSDIKSIKANFAINNQYLHMVSNTASSLPLEIWVSSTDIIKPQSSWQIASGYFQNFKENNFEFSIETYYKKLGNQIDYRENYVSDPTEDVESEFVFGQGEAYGIEFLLRKRKGALTGWVGYTLSRTKRTFEDINQGNPYPAFHDRPHDFSAVMSYVINPKWQISSTFIYTSGIAFTPIESIYLIDQSINYQFGQRNSARVEPYHRFDISAILTPKGSANNTFQSNWIFSVYNIYDRRNLLFYYYAPRQNNETGNTSVETRKVSFFPIIPSITWNFKWLSKKLE